MMVSIGRLSSEMRSADIEEEESADSLSPSSSMADSAITIPGMMINIKIKKKKKNIESKDFIDKFLGKEHL